MASLKSPFSPSTLLPVPLPQSCSPRDTDLITSDPSTASAASSTTTASCTTNAAAVPPPSTLGKPSGPTDCKSKRSTLMQIQYDTISVAKALNPVRMPQKQVRRKMFWRVVGLKGTLQIDRGNKDGKHGYMVSLYKADGHCQSSFYPFSGVTEELKAFIHDISQATLKFSPATMRILTSDWLFEKADRGDFDNQSEDSDSDDDEEEVVNIADVLGATQQQQWEAYRKQIAYQINRAYQV